MRLDTTMEDGAKSLDAQDLVVFDMAEAAEVATWVRSADEAFMWCGKADFPFSAATVASWREMQESNAFMLREGGTLVGYGELWFDAEEGEVELARLIVAPSARGKGVGQKLVRNLSEAAKKEGYSSIFMRVHPSNKPALECYSRSGFSPVDSADAAAWNAAQPVEYVWLQG
ncbi:GNAT family N-acetyltransferase [Streptomyces sp. TX20-6-3]|uniref:GNAT family N-acetyltransferase n=1 Tax=Streptomyces sp. TX20-6-3 TaxID=3028705 RepID=UPI0029A53A34|nr:GNAT family N-acetyltransferase [Streptomyces sp. TX20-6-3]MDX2565451.1 GNAT family N-acetyltransferase [Streptomyces sp. TX20-6-3]